MNHAILIKPKTITQSFFTLTFTSPSFQFEYHYYPAILMSTSSKGVFNWTNGASSHVTTINGALGSFHPTQMMLTKKLHAYGKFQHNYELIIKHNVENGVGQHSIYFVFFLLGRDDAPENALDLFLQKKTTIFDAATFLNNSFSEKSNNIYYTTAKTKDHVFVFPKVILVKNEILRNITGTPKPSSQIYREILLSEHVFESNRIPIEYGQEQIIDPISSDIHVSPAKPKEGFATTTEQTCYPVDDKGETYAQVVIGTGKLDGSNQVDALEDTQMMFAYAVLTIVMFFGIVTITNAAVTYAVVSNDNILKIIICFLSFSFFVVGFSIPIAKMHQRKKEGRDKMKISTASANLIGFVFLLAWGFMLIAYSPFWIYDNPKPYLLGIGVNPIIKSKPVSDIVWFFSPVFPFLSWVPDTATTGTPPVTV
uniref:Uncharacterized protein n=1 Tax=viral metagenome TaxID=1070528 RepID=A0A6C0HJK5_9ZZZZ